MRYNKLEWERRMRHVDETLYQGPLDMDRYPKEAFRGLVRFKKKPKWREKPKKTFEDRRGEVSGRDILLEQLTSEMHQTKSRRQRSTKNGRRSAGAKQQKVARPVAQRRRQKR